MNEIFRRMKLQKFFFEEIETNQGKILVVECASSFKVLAVYFADENDEKRHIEEMHEISAKFEFMPGSTKHGEIILNAINNLDISAEIPVFYKSETEFGVKVYNELRKIPRGQVRSYSEIASQIGQPTAARAVARACASNNLAYIVPCHRVIASNGKLSGYRWGMEKKKELLDAEGAVLTHCVM